MFEFELSYYLSIFNKNDKLMDLIGKTMVNGRLYQYYEWLTGETQEVVVSQIENNRCYSISMDGWQMYIEESMEENIEDLSEYECE